MKKKKILDLVDIPQSCDKSWDEMIGDDILRFCSHCEKNIYNLSEMSARNAKKLLFQSNGRVCVRLQRNSDKKIKANRRKTKIAASVLSATLAITSIAQAQNQIGKPPNLEKAHKIQKNTSQISFAIFDMTGAIIPNAEVKLTHDKTRKDFISKTNEKGIAYFSLLPQGRYEVEASYPGFHKNKMNLFIKEKIEPNIEMTLDVGSFVGVVVVNWYEVPIFNSILQEDFEVVKKYILTKKNVNIQDRSKVSMLHVAAQSGNLEIIELLVKAGAKINAKDRRGRTPILMIDSDEEETAIKIFKLFISKGADVDVPDPDEREMTLLMKACESDSLEGVKILLEAGANPNLKDDDGETPLMKTKSEEIKDLLKKYGAKK
jgi:hypothetical protein